jgi:hypothetical protein
MVIVIAAMRKLLHIIYGALKNETSFNKNIKTISIDDLDKNNKKVIDG